MKDDGEEVALGVIVGATIVKKYLLAIGCVIHKIPERKRGDDVGPEAIQRECWGRVQT
jgi:hypothetical protein